jgi:hypothetical protein
MTGITDLGLLLKTLEPTLVEGEFVYVTVPHGALSTHLSLEPIGFFREAEGMTLILPKETARQAGLAASAPMRCITMMVHSALEAVGMTAALTKAGISANVVAAYYHDHIFVPSADADHAVKTLRALAASAT